MRYSTVSQVNGLITLWYYSDEVAPRSQRPALPVTYGQKITVEEVDTERHFCALVRTTTGRDFLLQFTPDTPPILHQGKGGPPEFCKKRTQANNGPPPSPDFAGFICKESQRIDGTDAHAWIFDGDDSWVVCSWCGIRRRA